MGESRAMQEWRDHGIVLSARPFGEDGLLTRVMTREHGLHAGLARWTTRRRRDGFVLQPGVETDVVWRARLAEQLGTWTLEPVRDHAAFWLDDRRRLAAIAAAAAVVEAALPEREAHPALTAGLEAFLANLSQEAWAVAYIGFEIGVLAELGFALDLKQCAATGAMTDLVYVSPRTGRAVSAAAGAPYKDRMLTLPGFLTGAGDLDDRGVADGLKLTAHFLGRDVLGALNRDIPAARRRLQDLFDESDIDERTRHPGAQDDSRP